MVIDALQWGTGYSMVTLGEIKKIWMCCHTMDLEIRVIL